MMFDIYLVVDLKKQKRELNHELYFSSNKFYADIQYVQQQIKSESLYSCFLEREKTLDNYCCFDNIHCFIYGSVFCNNKYMSLTGTKNKRLNSKDLFEFYKKFGDKITLYLKGSFVLIFFEVNRGVIKVISDRLNVLPLYYAYKNGLLFISSSISMLRATNHISENIDEAALTSQLIFDYIIGDRTFFKGIKQVSSGSLYRITVDGIKVNEYWDVENLYTDRLLKKGESLKLMGEQLYKNVQLYSSQTKKLLVSLTGGFDGRTNLAMLRKNSENFLCYSYGMPGSKQIKVPQLIARHLNINYKPIFLDDQYEKIYIECAKKAIEFSNGTAPILRSNYPFAYQQLKDYSTTILTGLFGSEVLRPIHNLGIQINDHSERLFLSNNIEESYGQSIEEIKRFNYLKNEIIDKGKDELLNEIKSQFEKKYMNYEKITRFFFFIIKEGLRKYFMQEIQIERLYVTTYFPYWDDDFLDIVYQTPFAGIYNGFLKKSKVKRRKGQLLYAHIIRKYRPELGKIVLDRGYKPDDLIRPFPLNYIYLFAGVSNAKRYMRRHGGNDTFKSEIWSKDMIKKTLNQTDLKNSIFSDGLQNKFDNKTYLDDLLKYSHMISLANYL